MLCCFTLLCRCSKCHVSINQPGASYTHLLDTSQVAHEGTRPGALQITPEVFDQDIGPLGPLYKFGCNTAGLSHGVAGPGADTTSLHSPLGTCSAAALQGVGDESALSSFNPLWHSEVWSSAELELFDDGADREVGYDLEHILYSAPAGVVPRWVGTGSASLLPAPLLGMLSTDISSSVSRHFTLVRTLIPTVTP